MFTEFTAWTWISGAVIFALGGIAGYFIARQIKDQRTRELEKNLDTVHKELANYRQEVNSHFLKTSLLFNKLTDDYREVYEHLVKGAQNLCNENPRTTGLNLPQNEILPGLSNKPEPQALRGENTEHTVETLEQETVSNQSAPGKPEKVSREEKSLLIDEQLSDEDDVPLGEESAPAMDLTPDPNRSIH